jgi:hypothetical protein
LRKHTLGRCQVTFNCGLPSLLYDDNYNMIKSNKLDSLGK